MQNQTVLVKLFNNATVCLYAATHTKNGIKSTMHPFVPTYASTICKVQGQNFSKIMLWLDCPVVPKGAAYVALSRIRQLKDLLFMTISNPEKYKPTEHFTS